MIIDLSDTTASKIASALVRARASSGSPAMGMVLTLVVVADESSHYDALRAALEAAKEHPSRILGVIPRGGRGAARLDAEVRVGGEAGPGESVLLRLYGDLARHAESVVMPLLLPESPVVVWWPNKAPEVPSQDAVGRLAQRRVTDAAASRRSLETLISQCGSYQPGDTDLSWTRVTPWRALLAAALDQPHSRVTGATVEAERGNASADLLAAWLCRRLRVPTKVKSSRGPGITAAVLHTDAGDVAITRPDGRLARYTVPGQPERHVALKRRDTFELLAEELRRLDPDDVYAETVSELLDRAQANRKGSANGPARTSADERPAGGSDGDGAAGSDAAARPATKSAADRSPAEDALASDRKVAKKAAKKAPAEDTTAKQAPAKKAGAKKAPAKEAAAKKAPAEKAAKKAPGRKAAAERASAPRSAGRSARRRTDSDGA
ncbi:glucose-6-phosphate dehydrogenase assembly protein OpcA [Actinopolymorpha singaporensis]|uniref:Glucose-6-phosphate dehydrogenase assembly protein OpcA n=1 Tax=Actinopolymorpha singaporensis TaxID=117157 RepID=A0A1H1XLW2_9ACTN|nr:glucose-6-phosphate dehydrogenase assembly protein OpcA [Actinopolymorpha singaporensis]SDT10217.1 glucose-6-phosphate dehydrogenase assembly protein OpcA [Actinopolymorpha singaporensis]